MGTSRWNPQSLFPGVSSGAAYSCSLKRPILSTRRKQKTTPIGISGCPTFLDLHSEGAAGTASHPWKARWILVRREGVQPGGGHNPSASGKALMARANSEALSWKLGCESHDGVSAVQPQGPVGF